MVVCVCVCRESWQFIKAVKVGRLAFGISQRARGIVVFD